MDFFSELLTHLWAVLAIVVSVYCYFVVRTSKFVVVIDSEKTIVDNSDLVEVKVDNCVINGNVKHYRLIICYVGTKDIKEEDIVIPLSIINVDQNTIWHSVKVVTASPTFEPKFYWHKNMLKLTNTFIKNGDSVEVNIILESNNPRLYVLNRICDVDLKSKLHAENKIYNKVYAILFLLLFVVYGYLFKIVVEEVLNRNMYKNEYRVEYIYRGYKYADEWQYRADVKVDSLYDLVVRKKYDSNPNFYNLLDSIRSQEPSKVADSVYNVLKEKEQIKWGKEFNLDNDLTVTYINNRERSWSDIIKDTLFLLFVFIANILIGIQVSRYAVSYFSISRAYRYLRK